MTRHDFDSATTGEPHPVVSTLADGPRTAAELHALCAGACRSVARDIGALVQAGTVVRRGTEFWLAAQAQVEAWREMFPPAPAPLRDISAVRSLLADYAAGRDWSDC